MNICVGVVLTVLACWAGAVLITSIRYYRDYAKQQREFESALREYLLPILTVQQDEIGTNGKGEEIRLVKE